MRWPEVTRDPVRLFAVDVRSLATLRIGFGGVLLVDLANRSRDLAAHYSDVGVLPRATLEARPGPWRFCIHALSGSSTLGAGLFLLAAVFAVALALGLHTRGAALLSWLFLISLHARNPLVLQGGDVLLRLLLFWGTFLPLGETWSLDAGHAPPSGEVPRRVASPATAALLIQVCLVYWFSAIWKSPRVWLSQGSALYYTLSID